MTSISIPGRSAISRTVFVTASSADYVRAQVTVTATRLGGSGRTSTAVINPDSTNPAVVNPDIVNPDIVNPDIVNPDITTLITSAEIYNPTVVNPDIVNPDITSPQIVSVVNPDIVNPDIINPDIGSVLVVNPDIVNPDIVNPDIVNPDIVNPDIVNPDITSPGERITDFTWKINNRGNTTMSYDAKLLQKGFPLLCADPSKPGKCQLILRKVYTNPTANGCTLAAQAQNVTISNVTNPTYTSPDSATDTSKPSASTFSLGPGEGGRVTLRVRGINGVIPPKLPKPVGASFGNNTDGTPAASLAITSYELPVGVAGTEYGDYVGAALKAVGGAAATPGAAVVRTWSLSSGSLPAGLILDRATGRISGIPASPGSSNITVQVADEKGNVDRQSFTVMVNKLVVSSVRAYNARYPERTTVAAGDSVTVKATLANNGPATASNVVSLPVPVRVSGDSGASCSVVTPVPSSISGWGSADYTFSCPITGGDGVLKFQAQFGAAYVNEPWTTSASASGESNTVVVKNYQFTGFLSPLAAAGTPESPSYSGSYNHTRGVPLKWQLRNQSGALVSSLTSLTLLTATPRACNAPPSPGATPFVLYNPTQGATGNSVFRYDTTNNQFMFNWDTNYVTPGCYNLVIELDNAKRYATIVQLQ